MSDALHSTSKWVWGFVAAGLLLIGLGFVTKDGSLDWSSVLSGLSVLFCAAVMRTPPDRTRVRAVLLLCVGVLILAVVWLKL